MKNIILIFKYKKMKKRFIDFAVGAFLCGVSFAAGVIGKNKIQDSITKKKKKQERERRNDNYRPKPRSKGPEIK